MRQWLWRVVLAVVGMGSLTGVVWAQTPTPVINAEQSAVVNAYFAASNPAPLIGETFDLTLTVEVPNGVALVNFPTLPEDMGNLIILEQQPVESQVVGGNTVYTQKMIAVLWESGIYLTPEIPVMVNTGGQTFNNLVKSASLNVPALIELSGDLALRPAIKPRDLPYLPPYIPALVIVVVATLLFMVRVLLTRRRRAYIRQGTPAQIAIAELEDLKTQQLEAALIYPMVADKVRQYVQIRFGVRAVEMTTVELVETLRQQIGFSDTLRKSLRQLLEQADLVKFARFEPDTNATTRLVNFAIRWIREADAETGSIQDGRLAHE
jgi:hypothetical protein